MSKSKYDKLIEVISRQQAEIKELRKQNKLLFRQQRKTSKAVEDVLHREHINELIRKFNNFYDSKKQLNNYNKRRNLQIYLNISSYFNVTT